MKLSRFLYRFLADESGTTSFEYMVVASGIFAVMVASITAFGLEVHGLFELARDQFAIYMGG